MRLVDEREKRNLTQTEVARMTGISQSMLSLMEKGVKSGSDATKITLSNFYKVPVGYLFFDDDITQSNKKDKEVKS